MVHIGTHRMTHSKTKHNKRDNEQRNKQTVEEDQKDKQHIEPNNLMIEPKAISQVIIKHVQTSRRRSLQVLVDESPSMLVRTD